MADSSTIGSLIGLKPRRASARRTSVLSNETVLRPGIPFTEEVFQNVLMLERRRAERSGRPFVLMLVHSKIRMIGAGRFSNKHSRSSIEHTGI